MLICEHFRGDKVKRNTHNQTCKQNHGLLSKPFRGLKHLALIYVVRVFTPLKQLFLKIVAVSLTTTTLTVTKLLKSLVLTRLSIKIRNPGRVP